MNKIIQEDSCKKIVEKNIFPRPICLELCCNEPPAKGQESNVIKTLQAFSNEDKYNRLNPHKLNKSKDLESHYKKASQVHCDDVYSIDIGGRRNKYRLFYCITDTGICKILSLTSTDSHK